MALRAFVRSWLSCALAVLVALAPAVRAAEVIDRVMAIVAGQVITLSDVRMAQTFGLIAGPWAEAAGAGPKGPAGISQGVVLQTLIDRDLMLQEVEHYAPPEPDPAAIDEQLAAIRARFPGDGAYQRALALNGIDEARLRSTLRDNLRLDAYLAERFPPPPPPSESEVIEYYQTHPDEYAAAGKPLPFNEVRDRIVARLTAARRASLIGDWLTGLRSRADVTVVEAGGL